MKRSVISAVFSGVALALLAACSASPGMEADELEPAEQSRVSQALTATASGNVAKAEWKHFGPYSATAGTFDVVMTGTGDADLYVRKGSQPTAYSFDCRPYNSGSNESCKLTLAQSADVYVSVNGAASGTSSFNLTLNYQSGTVAPPIITLPGVVTSRSGTVAAGQWQHHGSFDAPAGEFRVQMTGTGDADLYVRKGSQPSLYSYDCRPYAANSTESCVLNLSAPGQVFVSVHGAASSSNYQLTISYPLKLVPFPIP